jgi:flagellar protein FliS
VEPTVRDQYLVTQVQTATAERRQLLLIEAALRLANRARHYRQEGRHEQALRAVQEAQEIIAHMLGVIDHNAGDAARSTSAVYDFIYRSLVLAGYRNDDKNLGDAIRILEIERETWQQVCERVVMERSSARPAAPHVQFGAPIAQDDMDESDFSGGFSLEV